jgi:hypothetical protein
MEQRKPPGQGHEHVPERWIQILVEGETVAVVPQECSGHLGETIFWASEDAPAAIQMPGEEKPLRAVPGAPARLVAEDLGSRRYRVAVELGGDLKGAMAVLIIDP